MGGVAVKMIGSVPVEVSAESEYARLVSGRFGVSISTNNTDPEVRLEVSSATSEVPDRDPDYADAVRTWSEPGRFVLAAGSATAVVESDVISVGGPLDSENDEIAIDCLLQSALAIRLSDRDRLLAHGAAVARDSSGILIVGGSGRGKSTAAAAAMFGGWRLLADDLVVVDLAGPRITGVLRPPMLMPSLVEGTEFAGGADSVVGDRRQRLRLPASVLDDRTYELEAVVVVDHGDARGGLDPLISGSLDIVQGALAVDPAPAVVRKMLPGLARLAALPTFRLSHAREESERLDRALEMLDEVYGLVH